ncbi:zinc finger MYM-type protein 5-like [Ctenocephalides felis]|uniref:zinc finger MYM-type protein 5-like n=1 Tax=Ctenocephalides felis TaxID=7515 RepID=UPI000E6E151F|nr:zinc finger MYM-type protein 5-like [Ctenocephalides felis]
MFGSLKKFLEKSSETENTCSSQTSSISDLNKTENKLSTVGANVDDNIDSNDEIKDIAVASIDDINEIDEAYSAMCMELNDPATWPLALTNKVLDILIEKGPVQNVQSAYAENQSGRSFSNVYFYR